MRRIALAVALTLTVVLAAAAAEAKGPRVHARTWAITKAEGNVRITFAGNEAAGCRAIGVCGISGTTTYSFGGEPQVGSIDWVRHRKRTVAFFGFFLTVGKTTSDVVSAGNPEHCTDTSEHEAETLSFEPRSQRVRFVWREEEIEDRGFLFSPAGSDPFDTRCAGPHLSDLQASGSMPFADIPYRVFRSPKSSFRTTGSRPFAGGGFAGTVDWDLRYGLRYRGR